ncbi:hypothetical protein RBWH47_05249 [Rhodopirellula baltica WH47]|uniref:Uncharacterized protein n=1 Tax=Rhodopirellula baltica WH47 TaxID=991778 RepID=F2AVF6_RHOBT|nr:hypothetical protein RBWH47_05249 [Rhodopirellula baltica WH47]
MLTTDPSSSSAAKQTRNVEFADAYDGLPSRSSKNVAAETVDLLPYNSVESNRILRRIVRLRQSRTNTATPARASS